MLGYNGSTKTLTGQGFLPSTTVWVRLSMIGSSVENVYGQGILDARDHTATFASDASGKLSAADLTGMLWSNTLNVTA